MSTLAERKRAELEAKRRSLSEELAFWQGLAAATGPLEKHHTQLDRIASVLGEGLARTTVPDDVVAGWAGATEQLLGLHHVWDFFRSKLALRLVERFRPSLVAADELAWACARPFYGAAVAAGSVEAAAVREPTLVYFDASGSPFAVARHQAYRNLLPAKRLDEVPAGLLKRLPVPVVGIPWHQQAHFPETAIVAHEAGHVVDDDLDLAAALLPAVQDRLGATWAAWLPEVLADLVGALQLGPAYRAALADVLAVPAGPAAPPPDAAYPPPGTRLLLVDLTLGRLGHPPGGAGPAAPAAAGGPPAAEAEAEAMVEVVAGTPVAALGGAALEQVDPFTPARQAQAAADAGRLEVPVEPTATDARVLVAAGVDAFARDPAGFAARGAAVVLARIDKVRTPGTRAARHETPAQLHEALDRRDAEAGAELVLLLG